MDWVSSHQCAGAFLRVAGPRQHLAASPARRSEARAALDEVIGVLRLGTIGERQRLEYDKRARAAGRHLPCDALAGEGVPVKLDPLALVGSQLDARARWQR
jgi:hypothetical protein